MEESRVPDVKPTNPKDAIGIKKVPMSCLSSQAVTLIARSYEAEKLDRIAHDPKFSTLFNAAVANAMNFWEGTNDNVSPPYWARMMAHIMALRAAELEGVLEDDRDRDGGLHVAELNAAAATIIAKYPDCVAPFTELPVGVTCGYKLTVHIANDTPLHILPWRVVMEMALGMMEGGRKYGRHNYRGVGVRASVYYDATMRHLADAAEGTRIDKDSGLSHLSKALSSSQVLLDSMVMGNWADDRPIRVGG